MNNDERRKKLAELSGGLEDDATLPGSSPDVIMKALQLNPKLLENRQTADIIKEVEKASSLRATVPNLTAGDVSVTSKNDDLAVIIGGVQGRIKNDLERLTREEKRIQDERRQLTLKGLEKIIDAVLTIDPNMVSPYTLMVLEDHKQFLRELGFDVRKVQERRKAMR